MLSPEWFCSAVFFLEQVLPPHIRFIRFLLLLFPLREEIGDPLVLLRSNFLLFKENLQPLAVVLFREKVFHPSRTSFHGKQSLQPHVAAAAAAAGIDIDMSAVVVVMVMVMMMVVSISAGTSASFILLCSRYWSLRSWYCHFFGDLDFAILSCEESLMA